MVGAGHHVRAKTNVPIIGIVMQPIPQEEHGDSPLWKQEFERVKSEWFERTKKTNPEAKREEVFPEDILRRFGLSDQEDNPSTGFLCFG